MSNFLITQTKRQDLSYFQNLSEKELISYIQSNVNKANKRLDKIYKQKLDNSYIFSAHKAELANKKFATKSGKYSQATSGLTKSDLVDKANIINRFLAEDLTVSTLRKQLDENAKKVNKFYQERYKRDMTVEEIEQLNRAGTVLNQVLDLLAVKGDTFSSKFYQLMLQTGTKNPKEVADFLSELLELKPPEEVARAVDRVLEIGLDSIDSMKNFILKDKNEGWFR